MAHDMLSLCWEKLLLGEVFLSSPQSLVAQILGFDRLPKTD